jgi:8-oxo-dGTP pyrophosphatase MutT (NUDIX family)
MTPVARWCPLSTSCILIIFLTLVSVLPAYGSRTSSDRIWGIARSLSQSRVLLISGVSGMEGLHVRGGDIDDEDKGNLSPERTSTIIQRDYRILSNETVYSNYRTVLLRRVEHSILRRLDGDDVDEGNKTAVYETASISETRSVVAYDLIAHKGTENAAVIVAWNSTSKTVTLVQEYHPGPHSRLYGPAAGLADPVKHRPATTPSDDKNNEDLEMAMAIVAARWELEEELRLRGGTWHKLTTQPAFMDKYVVCKVHPFLCIDPERVLIGGDGEEGDDVLPRDEEEEHDIAIIENVTVEQLMEMISNGQMNLVGSWTCLLAIQKLRELNEI